MTTHRRSDRPVPQPNEQLLAAYDQAQRALIAVNDSVHAAERNLARVKEAQLAAAFACDVLREAIEAATPHPGMTPDEFIDGLLAGGTTNIADERNLR